MLENEDTEKRPFQHEYLEHASGRPIKFLEMLEEQCPRCRPGKLALLIRSTSAEKPETVHCIKCDYQTTRPAKRVRLNQMNSGR